MSATVSKTNTASNEVPPPVDDADAEPENRQRLLLPDPTAFKLLREDACTKSIDSQITIEGYELYIVEQWACSRTQPTSVVTTFTGLPQHSVLAGVLSIPIDESEWSETLRSYIEAVRASHARLKKTPRGNLMVTNLSNFPSALTVIPVPGGDLRSNRESFVINEDLKRFGCSGRSGLTLTTPSSATVTKFVQQYHIHESVGVSEAVVSLVKLCQAALVIFNMLSPIYKDGLLCDMTESAVNKWWTKVGTEYYSIEPSDGILGPTTVSALLGLYMGARNRLNSCGGPTVKDAFDTTAMERSIYYYQRSQKLSGTLKGRLDRQTLDSLHRSTSKAANNERWLVPRAVKSTVAEFGGKGGEMVMGMVGRDKAGIAEIETLDITKFAKVVSGRYARRIWQGHTKKPDSVDLFSAAREDELMFSGDDTPRDFRPSKKRTTDLSQKLKSSTTEQFYSIAQHGSQSSLEGMDKDAALRKNVLRSMTGRMNEARSGIGRFKDAVGRTALRANYPRGAPPEGVDVLNKRPRDQIRDDGSQQKLPRRPRGSVDLRDGVLSDVENGVTTKLPQDDAQNRSSSNPDSTTRARPTDEGKGKINLASSHALRRRSISTETPEQLIENEVDTKNDIAVQDWQRALPHKLRASQSVEGLDHEKASTSTKLRTNLPRNMSASAIEIERDLIDASQLSSEENNEDPNVVMAGQEILSARNVRLARRIDRLTDHTRSFTKARIEELEALGLQLEQERADIEYEYAERINEHRTLQEGTSDLLQEEEAFLTETLRELEVLGARLEYELSTLVSKVEDVEDGVVDFEQQVQDLEMRLEMLGAAEERTSLWPMRVLGL